MVLLKINWSFLLVNCFLFLVKYFLITFLNSYFLTLIFWICNSNIYNLVTMTTIYSANIFLLHSLCFNCMHAHMCMCVWSVVTEGSLGHEVKSSSLRLDPGLWPRYSGCDLPANHPWAARALKSVPFVKGILTLLTVLSSWMELLSSVHLGQKAIQQDIAFLWNTWSVLVHFPQSRQL